MVDFVDVRDAKPRSWQVAADDWVVLARELEQAANDIFDRGAAAVGEHWTDEVGERAARRLTELATSFQVAAATVRGVVLTLDGLGEAVEAVQRVLHSAIDYATAHGFLIDAAGRVSQPPGVDCAEDAHRVDQANAIIAEAVESAARIDDEAADEFARLARAVADTDLGHALNATQHSASLNQLRMLRESLPLGRDPATVAAWWGALTSDQRSAYERALPVELADLDGIPDDVERRLRGGDGYNAVEAVRWARANTHNDDIDIFDNNCANFVSHALSAGGLDHKTDFWLGTFSDDSWTEGAQTGFDWLDARDYSHSASWAQAEAQRQFFLDNGGAQVALADARPGDIVYWVQDGPGGPTDPGNAHHAALVTAVTPDDGIHYTQHTNPMQDAGLDGRLPATEVTEGDQRIVVVRPKQTW